MGFPQEDVTVAAFLLKHPDVLARHEEDLVRYPFRNSFVLWVYKVLHDSWNLNRKTRFPTEAEAVMEVERRCKALNIPEVHKTMLVSCAYQVYRTDVSNMTGDRVVRFLYNRRRDNLMDLIELGDPESLGKVETFTHQLRIIRESPLSGGLAWASPYCDEAIRRQSDANYIWNRFIPTGWTHTDSLLKGGFRPGELYIDVTPTGKGKTLKFVHLANSFAKQGFRVLYIGLDNPRDELELRLMESGSGICKDECYSPEEFGRLVTADRGLSWGDVDPTKQLLLLTRRDFSSKPNARALAQMISAIEYNQDLRDYDIKRGVLPDRVGKVDVLIVDYADRCDPNITYRQVQKFERLTQISEDLQELAMIYNIPVITGSQVNRFGFNKENPTLEDIAGAFDKVQAAGLVSVTCQTEDEEKLSIFRLAWPKVRRGTPSFTTTYGFNRKVSQVWEIADKGHQGLPPATNTKKGQPGRNGRARDDKPLDDQTYKNVKRKGLEPAPALLAAK